MKLDFPKFKDFLILIQHAFKPADQAGEAMNKLELLRQGNRAAEEMITEFRLLCAEAELEEQSVSDNRHLIKLFANCKLFKCTVKEKDSFRGSRPQNHFWMD